METFDLEQVVSLEIVGDVLEDWQVRKLSDDQQVDAVAVVPEHIFSLEIQHMFVITQFDLYCAGGRFMPVDTVKRCFRCEPNISYRYRHVNYLFSCIRK